jgi:hypothetical protein
MTKSGSALLAALLLLGGCAGPYSGAGLQPGRATAQDVEALMGPAAERRSGSGGESLLYYPRLPFGQATYVARIGADGKLIAIEQRLTSENAAKVAPGRTRADEVRDLLGPPWGAPRYANLERDIWSYPMDVRNPQRKPQLFVVQLSYDGVVREAFFMNDPWFDR